MNPVVSLPIAAQNTLTFLAIIGAFLSLADILRLQRQRRYGLVAAACALFCLSYLTVAVLREFSEARLGSESAVADCFAPVPWAVFAALTAAELICSGLIYRDILKWRARHITVSSIKESMDGLPAGVCFYRETGRCVLVNHRMNEICFALTGRDLQNGVMFRQLALSRPTHTLPDGTVISFRHRVITQDGAPLEELIADDVTELARRGESLREANERVRRMSESMRAYGETIADTVRRREILDAKLMIHDGMNLALIATRRAMESGDEAEKTEVLEKWRSQALLMGGAGSVGVTDDLEALARVEGLTLRWSGDRVSGGTEALRLFTLSAREAMANAVKHAGASTLFISVESAPGLLRAEFLNDGAPPACPISETGGLAALRERLRRSGGSMEVEWAPEYRLTVIIPKEVR